MVDEKGNSLEERVTNWLKTEGYPLEFEVAQTFRREGFSVLQGDYVEDSATNQVREIDVVASDTMDSDEDAEHSKWVRIEYVVECKSSRDKPWVLFGSDLRMAPPACVAQTMGSRSGQGIVHARAHDDTLQRLETFAAPKRSAFGGRQAFSKGRDAFYDASQGVVSRAVALANKFDRRNRLLSDYLESSLIVLPIIVVDGDLFQAVYDTDCRDMKISPVEEMRLHWRGAESWRLHATIDVVSLPALPQFVKRRAAEVGTILKTMMRTVDAAENAALALMTPDNDILNTTPTPHSVPGIIRYLYGEAVPEETQR